MVESLLDTFLSVHCLSVTFHFSFFETIETDVSIPIKQKKYLNFDRNVSSKIVLSFGNQRVFLFRQIHVSDWSQPITQLPLMATLIMPRSSLEAVNHLQRANRIF